jgi:uncharacterized protein (TIGR02145 family)
MSLKKLNLFILAGAVALGIMACKKDEESTIAPFLDGSLDFSVPAYIKPKTTITMTPVGVEHPDGEGIGYYWKVTPGMSAYDTVRLENGMSPKPGGKESDGSFTYRFPDTLKTYTVSCYGFAKGYSTAYTSKYVTVVEGGIDGSITGTEIKESDPSIEFKGTRYYYKNHAGLDWFRNNLADPSAGTPYANAEAMSNVLGIYYSYNEALNACPEGWRLPTDAEWVALAASVKSGISASEHEIIPGIAADLMCNAEFNSNRMWEYWPKVGEITNKAGLALLPAGYANLGAKNADGSYPTAAFFGIYDYAAFWTADRAEGEEDMAYYRYIIDDQPDMFINKGNINTFGASVRCVREN